MFDSLKVIIKYYKPSERILQTKKYFIEGKSLFYALIFKFPFGNKNNEKLT